MHRMQAYPDLSAIDLNGGTQGNSRVPKKKKRDSPQSVFKRKKQKTDHIQREFDVLKRRVEILKQENTRMHTLLKDLFNNTSDPTINQRICAQHKYLKFSYPFFLNEEEAEAYLSFNWLYLQNWLKGEPQSKKKLTNFQIPNCFHENDSRVLQKHLAVEKGYVVSRTKKTSKINQDSYFSGRCLLQNTAYSFLGVCDGHGTKGKEAAEYVSLFLPRLLERNLQVSVKVHDILNAIQISFSQLDRDYPHQKKPGGTTVACAIITNDTVYAANVGDSCIVVFDAGAAIKLTEDQSVYNPRFKKEVPTHKDSRGHTRVYKAETLITRDIGNHLFQERGTKILSPKPEITAYNLSSKKERYIFIGSDGFFDFVTTSELTKLFSKLKEKTAHLNEKEQIEFITKSLVAACENSPHGCRDDTTLLIARI